MRIIIQVVKNAKVEVANKILSEIEKGFLLFVGFKDDDDHQIIDKMIEKLLKLRIFSDMNGKTNLCLNDVNGAILSISQFTLYASLKDGNRPSFVKAKKYDDAKECYNYFFNQLKQRHHNSFDGLFGADMQVSLTNDGPATYILDSEVLFA